MSVKKGFWGFVARSGDARENNRDAPQFIAEWRGWGFLKWEGI